MSIRRFKAYYIRTGEDVGIGIVKHSENWDDEVLAIHSIYSPDNLSNRDASVGIFQTISLALDDDEYALLFMAQASRGKSWHKPYASKIRVEKASYIRGVMYQAQLLAEDAIRRSTTVTETFGEPYAFSVIQQQRTEGKLWKEIVRT